MNELQKYVDAIADELKTLYNADFTDEERDAREESGEPSDLYDYTADALDIEYTLDSSFLLLGVRLWVTLGGPNICIDTRAGEVVGHWGTDTARAWVPSEICDEINEIFDEVYTASR